MNLYKCIYYNQHDTIKVIHVVAPDWNSANETSKEAVSTAIYELKEIELIEKNINVYNQV